MGLRQAVLRGGAYLMLRQALGLMIGFGGVLLLTRLIGPTDYGLYAGAFAILAFLNRVGRLGVDVYLELPPIGWQIFAHSCSQSD